MRAEPWIETHQRDLMTAVAEVRAALERLAEGGTSVDAKGGLDRASAEPSSLSDVVAAFGLSRFERAILLMCAGIELDSRFANVCAAAQGDPARAYPSFGLALAALPEPHWSALTPAAPLRRWRLVECGSREDGSLLTARLRIDERVLHALAGVHYLDERLTSLLEPVAADDLVPSHRALAREIAAAWVRDDGPAPLIELCGAEAVTRRTIAAAACSSLSMRLYALAAEHVPAHAAELEAFQRLWEREAALCSSALYIETQTLDRNDARAMAQVSRLMEMLGGALLLGTPDRWRPLTRSTVLFEVRKPTAEEQSDAWQSLLSTTSLSVNGHVRELVSQFSLTLPAIRASVREALVTAEGDQASPTRLWNASRSQARLRLDDLAQRIESTADWSDLVLPEPEGAMLREIAAQVAHRTKVYESWGFGARVARGLGISALFAGPSGTGKTMAAEVLANSLKLDLYRIDLAGVVSKYIGETEKNLRRVFDAAQDSGTILFFDEADALFGKRSEVKDSHDRYANIEISYLLQRMEAYRGLAVMATNLKGAVDSAFLRRIRFVVNFPFPNSAQRAELWRRIFPPSTPVDNLNPMTLARLNLAGGNIRNIALNAAFLAAAAGQPVRMEHVMRAARAEYAKLDKPISEIEFGDQG